MGNKHGKGSGDGSSPISPKGSSPVRPNGRSSPNGTTTTQSSSSQQQTRSNGRSSPLNIPSSPHNQANHYTSSSSLSAMQQQQQAQNSSGQGQATAGDDDSQPSVVITGTHSPAHHHRALHDPSTHTSVPANTMITVTTEEGLSVSVRGDTPLSRMPLMEGQDSFGEAFRATTTALSVDDFDLLKVIGKGSFGKVMQVRKKDNGKIYAMKVLKKEQLVARKQVAHTKTERKVLEEIHSPFIVSLKYAFQTENKLYMILDYFTGGELFFHLKAEGRFNEDRARFYAAEIILAIEILHQHTIAYRDLKPENVLLDAEGHVRLTDFGLSKEGITRTHLTRTFCGTPEYLAPEVVQGQAYGLPVDWWSLGTILFEMLTGLPPFYNQDLHVMYEKIVRARVNYPPYLSFGAKALLAALLERDPEKRLGTVGDADEVKAHPFFSCIDWQKLARRQVTPPFIPTNIEGKMDTSNVDEEFTREQPKDTPLVPSNLRPGSGQHQQVSFPGFTYAAPSSVGLTGVEGLHGEGGHWDR